MMTMKKMTIRGEVRAASGAINVHHAKVPFFEEFVMAALYRSYIKMSARWLFKGLTNSTFTGA